MFVRDFTDNKITTAIENIKIGKAAGFDDIYLGFMKHSGSIIRLWQNFIQTS